MSQSEKNQNLKQEQQVLEEILESISENEND